MVSLLTETDKRVLLGLLLVFILLIAIAWYLGYITKRFLVKSGKHIDDSVSDVVTTRVITDPKHFKKYAHKKNWRIFFKTTKIPVLILFIGFCFLFIQELIYTSPWTYNPFSVDNGFASIMFLWNLDDPDNLTTVFFFPFKVFKSWPHLIHTPEFKIEAWSGYIFVPCLFTGSIWYLINVSTLIARYFRIRELSHSVFAKSLDNFNQNQQNLQQTISNNVASVPVAQPNTGVSFSATPYTSQNPVNNQNPPQNYGGLNNNNQ